MFLSKRQLYLIGLITLFGLGAIGLAVVELAQGKPWTSLFQGGMSFGKQIIVGIAYGTITAIIAWRIILSDLLTTVRIYFGELFQGVDINIFDIAFLSICAGVGEEILFRGAIQEWLGIWFTSLIFIMLHGYLNPMNWRITVYGIYMVILSAGLGYLYEYVGMFSAITAHFTVDMILLYLLVNYQRPRIQHDMDKAQTI